MDTFALILKALAIHIAFVAAIAAWYYYAPPLVGALSMTWGSS